MNELLQFARRFTNGISCKCPLHACALILVLSLAGCGGGSGSFAAPSPSGGSNDQLGLRVATQNGGFSASWQDTSADTEMYRVLYWQDNEATPEEQHTSTQSVNVASLAPGQYTVIVEAYDELGNSVFSAPVAVEIP